MPPRLRSPPAWMDFFTGSSVRLRRVILRNGAARLSDRVWSFEKSAGDERMAGMGYVSRAASRAFDKLPDWLKLVLGVLVIGGLVYGVARDGWIFLLKAIFSPEI